MVAAVGFIMIIVIVALLLKGKMSPIVVLVVVPSLPTRIRRGSSGISTTGYWMR